MPTLPARSTRRARPDGRSRHIVGDVIAIFCALFDSDRPLFSFLLLSQHAFLADVPAGSEANVVEAVAGIFRDAMIRGRIPQADADLVAAMALGIVAQPATFILYGRLEGPLSQRMPALAAAVLAAAGAGAPRTALLRQAASAP